VWEALASRWPLICIDGIGGIGKTPLALEVADECLRTSRGEFPADGIPTFDTFVWTTAKDRELALSDILDTIARTLDCPYIAQLPIEEKPSEAVKVLRVQKCLLIADNFETITDDAVRGFLLDWPEPSKALITSREQKLRQARAISLRGMDQGEALALIRSEGKRLGLRAVENGDKKVLLRLNEATGGAPLAIKWAVGQMKQRGESLDTVLDSLYAARGDIFENMFARSWELLSEIARRVLMVMPIFAASASKEAIEATSDVHKWDLDDALGQLVEMWLVEASEELDETKRRYSVHPLTRAFAGAQLTRETLFGKDAQLRFVRFLLNVAKRYGGYCNWQGLDELEKEHKNFVAACNWCYSTAKWKIVIEFGWALSFYLYIRGYWNDRVGLCKQAVDASTRENDNRSIGWGAYNIARTLFEQSKYDEARHWALMAKEALEKTDYQSDAAFATRILVLIAQRRGRYDEAQQYLDQMPEIGEKVEHTDEVAHAKMNLGDIAYGRGEYDEAREWYKESLVIGRKLSNNEIIATALKNLGDVAFELRDLGEAWHRYEEGLQTAQTIGIVKAIAQCKLGLARVAEKEHRLEQPLVLIEEVQEIFERLEMAEEIEETRELVERLEHEMAKGTEGANEAR